MQTCGRFYVWGEPPNIESPTFDFCLQPADRIADDQAVLIELVITVIPAHGQVALFHTDSSVWNQLVE